ncbi:exoribonuclease R [Motilimonas pumila]|uniref:Exoribonuclease R n=1 Tax=Motilimonas pumila TaxID=2303987 RepID=A0A418YBB8_9GAMM|nr:exoribonuclease R [Motilimonas pumila]RJG40210.1 exoribonuclease R [Motilimonas pumila]
MQLDYTFECLNNMERQELESFSERMISKMVPPDVMNELFTFEAQETENEDRLLSARLDATLRMTAIALSELQQAFDDSEHARQNSERMTRLVLWHFYAVSFQLERAITLQTHCQQVEIILKKTPSDVFSWVKVLTDLLHKYAEIDSAQRGEA